MELTIEQALQQALGAHRAGKLQDAEALYRAILHVQPKHPDANHNLGVIAVALNKPDIALPLFQLALEFNSNHVQFWISYVDALIKTNQLEIAKNVLNQGRKLGLAGKRVDALEEQLKPITVVEKSESIFQKQTPSLAQQLKKLSAKKDKKNYSSPNQRGSPSPAEVNGLLEQYEKGRFDLAENLAKTITQKYSDHQFGWTVLGAIFKQTGKLQESLIANQRAVAISPNDAAAHSNLGITLKEFGRLADAETSYKKAIAIKPNYPQAHFNLGITLQELGRLADAEASYNNAIALKPDYTQAHYNLANTLQELGRLEDSEVSYRKAIALKPDLAGAHSNLGNTLMELGRHEEAVTSYKKAISLQPDLAEAHHNLGETLKELGRLEDAEASYRKAILIKPELNIANAGLGELFIQKNRHKDGLAMVRRASGCIFFDVVNGMTIR